MEATVEGIVAPAGRLPMLSGARVVGRHSEAERERAIERGLGKMGVAGGDGVHVASEVAIGDRLQDIDRHERRHRRFKRRGLWGAALGVDGDSSLANLGGDIAQRCHDDLVGRAGGQWEPYVGRDVLGNGVAEIAVAVEIRNGHVDLEFSPDRLAPNYLEGVREPLKEALRKDGARDFEVIRGARAGA
jgi:hypothetical protein